MHALIQHSTWHGDKLHWAWSEFWLAATIRPCTLVPLLVLLFLPSQILASQPHKVGSPASVTCQSSATVQQQSKTSNIRATETPSSWAAACTYTWQLTRFWGCRWRNHMGCCWEPSWWSPRRRRPWQPSSCSPSSSQEATLSEVILRTCICWIRFLVCVHLLVHLLFHMRNISRHLGCFVP